MPTLPYRGSHYHRRVLVFRILQRTDMAHHDIQGHSDYRIHRRPAGPELAGPIRRHGDFHHWDVRSEQPYPRMVRQRVWADEGEKGRRYQYSDNRHERQFRVDTLLVAQERRAEVHDCHDEQCCV